MLEVEEERYRIARLRAEFVDPETEAAFREHVQADWVRDTRIAVTITALFYLAFAVTDYLVLGASEEYRIVFLTRVLVCCCGLAIALSAARFWRLLVGGITPTLVEGVALAGFLSITLLRPYEAGWHGMSLMVMLLGIYVFIPNRFLPTLAVALTSTLAFVWLLNQHFELPANQLLTLSLLLLAMNLFGALSAMRVSRLRREAYRDAVVLRQTNLALHQEIEERQRLETHLRELAHLDDLTGIPNRRRFFDLAERALHAPRRQGLPASVLILDVDYFKQIVDTYGQVRADEVLKALVRICRQHLREHDLFARTRDDEFVALLPQTDLHVARELAERLRVEVLATAVALADAAAYFSISIGLAQWRPGENLSALMRRADTALHSAQVKGRNRVEQASDHPGAELLEAGGFASQNSGNDLSLERT